MLTWAGRSSPPARTPLATYDRHAKTACVRVPQMHDQSGVGQLRNSSVSTTMSANAYNDAGAAFAGAQRPANSMFGSGSPFGRPPLQSSMLATVSVVLLGPRRSTSTRASLRLTPHLCIVTAARLLSS